MHLFCNEHALLIPTVVVRSIDTLYIGNTKLGRNEVNIYIWYRMSTGFCLVYQYMLFATLFLGVIRLFKCRLIN